ncbi:hypothetical protein C8Q80DRAFT_761068 [Daedaleopsis nitida]|nr:hypothetical protein C8Q80DRAFT_761068 [Daedaleopsis nitida]
MALLPATRQARCPRVTSQIRRSPLSAQRLSARHRELRRSERHSRRTGRKLPAHLSTPVHVDADGGRPSQALPFIRPGPPRRASVARDGGYIRESIKEDSWHSEVLSMPPISAQVRSRSRAPFRCTHTAHAAHAPESASGPGPQTGRRQNVRVEGELPDPEPAPEPESSVLPRRGGKATADPDRAATSEDSYSETSNAYTCQAATRFRGDVRSRSSAPDGGGRSSLARGGSKRRPWSD